MTPPPTWGNVRPLPMPPDPPAPKRTTHQIHLPDPDWETLDVIGGPRGRSATVAALIRAYNAGDIPTLPKHLADVKEGTRAEQRARMGVLKASRGAPEGGNTGDPTGGGK